MYLYYITLGGFNDILVGIYQMLDYCKKTNRILLLNGFNSVYKINFSQFFNFNDINIICDTNEIISICQKKMNIYPEEFNGKIENIINGQIRISWNPNSVFCNYSSNKMQEIQDY